MFSATPQAVILKIPLVRHILVPEISVKCLLMSLGFFGTLYAQQLVLSLVCLFIE